MSISHRIKRRFKYSTDTLSVFDHFVGLAPKGLICIFFGIIFHNFEIL